MKKNRSLHFAESVSVAEARQFFLGLPIKENLFKIVSVGCERCLPGYLVDRKALNFSVVELVVEGEGRVVLDGVGYSLSPGSLFFYQGGEPHRIENYNCKPMLKYFIAFSGTDSSLFKSDFFSVQSGSIRLQNYPDLSDLYELILLNTASNSSVSEEVCTNLLRVLLLKVGERIDRQPTVSSRSWDTYERVLLHLRKNYLRLKSMKQLANETHLDPAYLSRVFKRFHKESPYSCLMRMKMEHAASLLLKSGMLVKEIAYELNFENPYHFSRSFKNIIGVSPDRFSGRFDS